LEIRSHDISTLALHSRRTSAVTTDNDVAWSSYCSGLVAVHEDGTFACSAVDCLVNDTEDPWDMVRHHAAFASCEDISPLGCPKCTKDAA
jgi:hypothetical protein